MGPILYSIIDTNYVFFHEGDDDDDDDDATIKADVKTDDLQEDFKLKKRKTSEVYSTLQEDPQDSVNLTSWMHFLAEWENEDDKRMITAVILVPGSCERKHVEVYIDSDGWELRLVVTWPQAIADAAGSLEEKFFRETNADADKIRIGKMKDFTEEEKRKKLRNHLKEKTALEGVVKA